MAEQMQNINVLTAQTPSRFERKVPQSALLIQFTVSKIILLELFYIIMNERD